jgi:hypothetical protein
MRKTVFAFAVIAASSMLLRTDVGATTYFWDMPCDESQVNNSGVGDGSTDSTATGNASLRYDTVSDFVGYDIAWNALEGLLTAIHVHGPASPAGSNSNHFFNVYTDAADVIADGVDRTTDSTADSRSLTEFVVESGGGPSVEEIVSEMVADMAYVNIHSDIWPSGEIRCHLVSTSTVESQTKGQQKCSGAINKGYSKTVAATGKTLANCAKAIAKGDIGGTILDCVTADADERIFNSVVKASEGIVKKCSGNDKDGNPLYPDFGGGSSVTIGDDIGAIAPTVTPIAAGSALVQVTPESVDAGRSACEVGVGRAVAKCVDAIDKEYDKCAKLGLKGKKRASFVVAEDIEACVSEDAKGKIAKTCGAVAGKLGSTVDKVCAGVDFSTVFGACPAPPLDGAEAAACLEQSSRCSACLGRTAVMGLAADCDIYDDGSANVSCGP